MNSELRLRFLKLLINVPLRLLDRVLPDVADAEYPQTQMLLRTYTKMLKAYRLDCVQGTFGVKPDGNFELLLRVSMKLLGRVAEDDRYYRAWLGLAFLLAYEEVKCLDLSAEQLLELIRKQWLTDLRFLSPVHVEAYKDEFVKWALCDYLGNLARMDLESTGKQEGGWHEEERIQVRV
jgi:hypothetical protein